MQLDVVNEKNEVVGTAHKEEVFEKKLNHRRVHILIFNDKGEVFLQQLGANKKYCPGHWGTSAASFVQSGESYEDAANRELKRQLEVETELTKILEIPYDHYKMRKFMEVFRGIHKGALPLNLDEFINGKWFSISEVKDMVKKNQKIHPELATIIENLYNKQ
jgi:isopentenyldiphosphate isomerase